jgi:anti-sigma regulatory factor (Ser/Thr protein kinase)
MPVRADDDITHGLEQPVEHATRRISAVLDPVPASVASGRRAVDRLLAAEQPHDGSRQRVWLIVSELLSNAIIHGSANDPITLELHLHRGRIQIRVRNGGLGFDLTALRRERSDGGRGLAIVAALSERWSIHSSPDETTVTAEVPLEPQ